MYAIIDNSTLTAVQRLMGEITIKDKNTIDGDILSLESFVQSVLFYDDIFYINDYKPEYRNSRSEFFKYVYPIDLGDDYDTILSKTQELTNEFIPQIKNRKVDNESMKDFFDMLKMNITFTWDISSSVYYLTHKILQEQCGVDIPKYSKLSTMIFSQFFSGEPTNYMAEKKPIIYDSKGNIIDEKYTIIDKSGNEQEAYISKQVSAFLAGLSWLDFRTTFYTLISNEMGFDLILHPIRNSYEVNLLKRYSSEQHSSRIIIKAMNDISTKTLNSIISNTQPMVIKNDMPMFSVWLVNKAGGLDNFIENLYTLKGDKIFSKTRDILNKLDELHKEEGNSKYAREANLLVSDLEKQSKKLMDSFGILPSYMDITSPIIKAYNIGASLNKLPTMPIMNYKIGTPKFVKKFYNYSGFGGMYKAIISDLTSISKLGKYHDMLSSKVLLDRDAAYYNIKEENSIFANAKSYWKVPL